MRGVARQALSEDLGWQAERPLPPRLLAGGSPVNLEPRVAQALTTPLIGQFDPAFTAIMDEVADLGRRVFQAGDTAHCVPVSGLPDAALEAVLNTLLEPGDRLLVVDGGAAAEGRSEPARPGGPSGGGGDLGRGAGELDGGAFGGRLAALAQPYGVRVERLPVARGAVLEPATLEARLVADVADGEPIRLVAVAHLDAATGTLQPLADLAAVCHAQAALLLVDASLSLGGCELRFADWRLDVAVSGLEACLGGPAGLSPVVYSEAVAAAFDARSTPPITSYLDLLQLQAYWSPERLNHHTAPTSLVYGAREALRLVLAEGLSAGWARHAQVGRALRAGLVALGLKLLGGPARQSPVLCVIEPSPDFQRLRRVLREDYAISLGAGGQVSLVGPNARRDTLLSVLAALEQALRSLGHAPRPGAARAAALEAWAAA